MAVTKRLRYEVLRRDNHTCRYCGASAPDVKLTIDHVTPVALGGRDEPSNLVTACEPCNSGKSSVPADALVVADVEENALRWAAAIEKAAEIARADYESRLGYRLIFRDSWDEWQIGPEGAKKPVPLDANWQTSLDSFHEAGLPDWELDEAVRAAMTNRKVTPENTFRYFAGICWTKIRQMQDQARQIVDAKPEAHAATVDEEDLAVITKRWRSAYRQRCDVAGIQGRPEHEEWQVQSLHNVVAPLLRQGYSVPRVADAAAEAGQWLTGAVQDYLGGWGDLAFDAMASWINAWQAVDSDHPAFKSAVPSPDAWQQIKEEIQEAVRAGVLDRDIVEACQEAGTIHLSVLTDVPDWDR